MHMGEALSLAYFESRRRIRKEALDAEIEEHPELQGRAGEQAALARSREVGAKDELKRVEASRFKHHAKRLKAKGESAAEANVKASVQIDPERRAAFEKWLTAATDADIWESLADTFRQRGYLMRDLAGLMISGINTPQHVGGPARQWQDNAHEERRRKLAEKRKPLTREG